MKQFLFSFFEILETLIIALVSIYLIYALIAQPFRVEGPSMEPNFSGGDYLIVDEVSYRFRNPARGEVIVLHNPEQRTEFFIKRIVGLPGEEIIIRDGEVFIDNERLEEAYLPGGVDIKNSYYFDLAEDEYFVMGDNRPKSSDSRAWGPLERSDIVGTVRVRFWPLDELAMYRLET